MLTSSHRGASPKVTCHDQRSVIPPTTTFSLEVFEGKKNGCVLRKVFERALEAMRTQAEKQALLLVLTLLAKNKAPRPPAGLWRGWQRGQTEGRVCSIPRQPTTNDTGAFKTKNNNKKSRAGKRRKSLLISASSLAFSAATRVPFARVRAGCTGKDKTCTAHPAHCSLPSPREQRVAS